MAYDIIGDIHGQAEKLEALLRTLGYRDRGGAWRHEERQVIFVGDFTDRGPAQVRSIDIARRMVDAGANRIGSSNGVAILKESKGLAVDPSEKGSY